MLTDPPYYNNLAYSELSDFYHVWLRRLNLPKYNTANHAPMAESLYGGKNSTSPAEQLTAFADGLASVFAECGRVLARGGMMVFSYSHNQLQAWAALAYALTPHSAIRAAHVGGLLSASPISTSIRTTFRWTRANPKATT